MARNDDANKDLNGQDKPKPQEPEYREALGTPSDSAEDSQNSDDFESMLSTADIDAVDASNQTAEEDDDYQEYEDEYEENEDEDEEDEDEDDDEKEDRELIHQKPSSGFFRGFFIGAGAFLAAAAVFILFFFNIIPNPFPGCLTAISFDKYKVSVATYEFFYHFYAGNHANYYSDIDLSTSLFDQTCSIDTSQSWGDYISNYTETELRLIIPVAKTARKEGLKLNSNNQATYDGFVQNIYDNAKSRGISSKELIASVYGKHTTKASVLEAVEDILLADQYQNQLMDSYDFTDENIATYYNENKADFDLVSFNFYPITYDGSTVTKETAKTKAEAFASKAKDSASFAGLAYQYASEDSKEAYKEENATLRSDFTAENIGIEDLNVWLFDDTRKLGDTLVYDYGDAFWVLMFQSRRKDTTPTVNVRSILIEATDTELAAASIAAAIEKSKETTSDSSSSPQNSKFQDTYQRAQSIYNEWKNGDKTEESFAALAKKHSSDEESKYNGGLLKNVTKTSNEFGVWCFDQSRKPGDTTLIVDDSVFYILYYSSAGYQGWELSAKTTLAYKQYKSDTEAKYAGFEIKTNHLGYRYLAL